MKYYSDSSRTISITHVVPGLIGHSIRTHPHTWLIRATFMGDPIAADGMAVVPEASLMIFDRMIAEYEDSHLNDLIGPGVPSLEGFAMHLMERLSGVIPQIVRLSVDDMTADDNRGFLVSRDP